MVGWNPIFQLSIAEQFVFLRSASKLLSPGMLISISTKSCRNTGCTNQPLAHKNLGHNWMFTYGA
jgi:hypothetical protein